MKSKLISILALGLVLGLCALHGHWLAIGSTIAGCVAGFIIGKP